MRTESHKEKMARKAKERALAARSVGTPLVLANLSKSHPDYGMSPTEHAVAKAARTAV